MTAVIDPATIAAVLAAIQAQQTGAPAAAPSAYAPQLPTTPNGHPGVTMPPVAEAPPEIGSIEDFLHQKTGGSGKTWRFRDENTTAPMVGQSYWGIVAREIVKADCTAITHPDTGAVQKRKDQSIKWQMWCPMRMIPQPGYEDGLGQAIFKGDAQDKLTAAMALVGAPIPGLPEAGAFIQKTLVRTQRTNLGPKYIYDVAYRRPSDAWTIERKAEVDAAHEALGNAPIAAPSGPPAQPPAGSPPEAYAAWANAMAAYSSGGAVAAPVVASTAMTLPPPTAAAAPAAVVPPVAAQPVVTSAPVATPAPAAAPAVEVGQADPLAALASQMGVDVSQLAGLDDAQKALMLKLTGKMPATVG
jgi:hypothetical protein